MASGFPGQFQGGYTTGYLNIGAVQKDKTGTERGFPGSFQGGYTTGYINIGAAQKEVTITPPTPVTTGGKEASLTNLGAQ